ncbi:M16 family metallopeptidase [Arenibaculum pallidiluteum]|uniref:M16 family metallopeptidase n=1 Tax=Arenibaculum pallidiluteum TaxID=2812559 RepID=UPI001A96EE5C|nr:pitrilysin family protein [Arenibaculum pallidiluteum]
MRSVLRTVAAAGALLLALLAPASAFEVERVISPGGIEAWLIRDQKIPILSVQFAFEGGAVADPKGKEGLANLVSTLLDEGAGPLDSQEFQRRIADAGITLGFSASSDAFFGNLKTLVETEDEAVELLRLALTAPRFDAEAVERMKQAVGSQIRRDQGDPDTIVRQAFYAHAFPDSPYGRRARGTLESVAAIGAEDLRGFVRDRLAKANLKIGVTGDITPERLGGLLDRVFGGLPAQAAPLEIGEVVPSTAGETLVVERPTAQSIVLMGQPGLKRRDPDWFAASLMNYVLGGGSFSSRLMNEIREKRGLTYGVYSYLLPFENTALMMASGSTANPNAGAMIGLLREEWRRMAEQGPTQEELDDAKTYLTGSFPLQFTGTDRIAEVLLQVQRDDLGIDYLDRRDALIQAVTLDDVRRVARELLQPGKLMTVVVGRPEGLQGATVIQHGS